MLVGRIIGKTTPERFFFKVTEIIKKLDFVAVRDPERHWILGRVDSIFQEKDKTVARVSVIGYKDQRGLIKTPRMPFKPGSLVYKADDYLVKKVLDLKSSGLYVGLLQSSEKLKVFLDPQKLITKHVAILAKSGFGKSYLAGVILEEFIENQIPAIIIDPHGEYVTLREKNDNPEELKYVSRFEISPKSYRKNVDVYCLEKNLTEGAKKLKFSDKLSHHEIYEMLPFRLSGNQMNIIYAATRNLNIIQYSLDDLIKEVELVRSKAKWNVISVLQALKSTGLFTDKKPTSLEELIKPGKISVINLRGIDPDLQTLVVYKLGRDLFELRKSSKIPPFLFIIEEAHNFCPERGFGEVISSKMLRTIASEGRKFGMGMCIISQRAARVDKNVLSQCNTQIFLRVNNPNDIKSISDSVEGITHELESEIKTLPVGTALITGVIDQPLLIEIRIRRSKHGGTTSILTKEKPTVEKGKPQFFVVKVMEEELKNLIKKKIEQFRLIYYPMWRLYCQFREKELVKEDNLLVDGITGELVYRRNDTLKRTENVFKITDLPMKEKAVVLYLTTYGESPAPKIAEKLNLSLSTVKQTLESLQKLELVMTDGFLFKSNVSVNFTDVIENQVNDELSLLRSKGELLDFSIEKDEAESILNIFQPDFYEITQCYYPYWIVECEDGDTLVIDGLTGKRDDYLLDVITLT